MCTYVRACVCVRVCADRKKAPPGVCPLSHWGAEEEILTRGKRSNNLFARVYISSSAPQCESGHPPGGAFLRSMCTRMTTYIHTKQAYIHTKQAYTHTNKRAQAYIHTNTRTRTRGKTQTQTHIFSMLISYKSSRSTFTF